MVHKELARTFWNPHHLVDVKAFSEEDLADYREFQVMAQVLKHIRDPEAGEISDRKVFETTLLKGLTTIEEDTLMTWANYYRQEGKQQGMQQGMQTVALKMLAEKMPFEKISRVTDLSEKELQELQATLH